MTVKRRWYELLLPGLAFVAIMVSLTMQNAFASYVEDSDYGYDSYESEEGPGEDNNAVGSADEEGECVCTVWADCDANGVEGPESTYANAWAYGTYIIDWTWNGPPGEAPGGTLDWSIDGGGNSYAYGYNKVPDGDATSVADANSGIWSDGTEGSAYANGEAYGAAIDEGEPWGDWTWDAVPWQGFSQGPTNRWAEKGNYSFSIEWEFAASNPEEDIASVTTYVYFSGGADCGCASSANAYDTAESHANSDSYAFAGVDGTFYPNP